VKVKLDFTFYRSTLGGSKEKDMETLLKHVKGLEAHNMANQDKIETAVEALRNIERMDDTEIWRKKLLPHVSRILNDLIDYANYQPVGFVTPLVCTCGAFPKPGATGCSKCCKSFCE
jgi:hypothetical protein